MDQDGGTKVGTFLLAAFLCVSGPACDPQAQPQGRQGSASSSPAAADSLTAPTTVTIAEFNSLRLGSNNQKDTAAYCSVLVKYDVIGLVEVMNTEILDAVKARLSALTNVNWDYVATAEPIGRSSYKEYYAIMYRTDRARLIDGSARVWPDTDDTFEREPFVASFRSGAFDFTIILVHSVFGDAVADRRAEAEQLGTVFQAIQDEDSTENDVILMGDFNLPSSDKGWENLKGIPTMRYGIPPTVKTTLNASGKLSSSYDNIWFQGQFTDREFGGTASADYYYEIIFSTEPNPGLKAFKTVSDHVPVFAAFSTDKSDDD